MEYRRIRSIEEKLLDQQQQLTLISNKKIESLELEAENKEDETYIKKKINGGIF